MCSQRYSAEPSFSSLCWEHTLPGTLLRACKPPVTCQRFFKAMDEYLIHRFFFLWVFCFIRLLILIYELSQAAMKVIVGYFWEMPLLQSFTHKDQEKQNPRNRTVSECQRSQLGKSISGIVLQRAAKLFCLSSVASHLLVFKQLWPWDCWCSRLNPIWKE